MAADAWVYTLGREIGERIAVEVTPPSGVQKSKPLIVEGISHTVTADRWVVGFSASPAVAIPNADPWGLGLWDFAAWV